MIKPRETPDPEAEINAPIRLLHLEDDPRDAELIRLRLQGAGLSCDIKWVNGKGAFESALDSETFDLVLSDYKLPNYDGLSALRRVQEKQPELPVIMISGGLSEEEAVECLKAGATDYVLKQRLQRLATAVRRALAEKEERAALRHAQQEISRQNVFLRQVIDLNPNYIFAKDREGRFVLANHAVAQAYGTTVDEMLHKTDADFNSNEEEVEHFRRGDIEAMETLRGVFVAEETITDAAGRRRWLQTVKRPILSENGTADRVLGVAVDITERKRAEDQLRSSKALLERAERIAGVGGWEVDLRSNDLTWSEQTFRIHDLKPGPQPTLAAAFDHFALRERELLERTLQACIQHRQPWDLELPMTTAAGRAIWIRSVGAVELEAGRPVRLVGAIQDITAARVMREQLARSNAMLRSILDNLPCGLSVYDADLRLVAHNAAYRDLLDLPHDLVEGPAPTFEAVMRHNAARGDYGPGTVDDIAARLVANARHPVHMQNERQTHDGKALEVRSAPMPGGGFVTTYMDVTERKNMERLKSEFISTVTHELRTPLTSIYGSLSLLASGAAGPLPASVQELVSLCFQSSERLVRLINDVLDVERIEARLMDYAMSLQRLAPLVQKAADATRGYADKHGVRFEFESRIDSVCVLADPDRIEQVVINLLSNAVKFSDKATRVSIRMAELGEHVRVCVVDEGPGIPEEFRPRIFERFSQADSSDRRQKGGTGLGLNICRSIVTEHGGRIDYHSVLGQGTEFYFDLPIVEPR